MLIAILLLVHSYNVWPVNQDTNQDTHADRVAISDLFEVDGKEMKFEIFDSHVEKSMDWPEKDQNPPLPIRKAISKSRDVLDQYERRKLIREGNSWALKEVVLRSTNSEIWHYRIVYRYEGGGTEVNILILMDGRWIVPKESKTNDAEISK